MTYIKNVLIFKNVRRISKAIQKKNQGRKSHVPSKVLLYFHAFNTWVEVTIVLPSKNCFYV